MNHSDCNECFDNRSKLSAIEDDNHRLEQKVLNLQNALELKDIECDVVAANLAELSEYVLDLERALAEAHLMSQDVPPGPTGLRGDPV